jgi:hypothetical protein
MSAVVQPVDLSHIPPHRPQHGDGGAQVRRMPKGGLEGFAKLLFYP